MKTNTYILNTIVVLLLALWIPIGIYQYLHFAAFKTGILRQPIGDGLAWTLIYLLPAVEITIACLLVSERFRRTGLLLSSALLTAFTGYIGLALIGAWGTLPCACGLIISGMSWMQHLWFNLFFLIISITGYILSIKFDKKQLREDNNTNSQDELFNTIPPNLSRDRLDNRYHN